MNHKKLAELIGILLGDGNLGIYNCGKGKQYILKVTLNSKDDIDYIYHINNLLKELFQVEPKIKFRKKENTVDIIIFKRKIVKYLLNDIGLVKAPKWNRAKIPAYYYKKYGRLILRGLFDTDGCVSINNNNGIRYPRIEIKICPAPFQKQIINLLKKDKFNFKVYKLDKNKVRITLNGKKELKKWLKIIDFSNKKHLEKAYSFYNKK